MKKLGLFYIVSLLIVGILPNWSLAQDQTQGPFSEGAKMRLGKGRINDIKFSPDGSRFAVATPIGIWMYDAHTGEELSLIAVLPGEGREITTIAFSPDGHTLASGEWGGIGRLWDVLTGKPIATLQEISHRHDVELRTLAFSADGMKLVGATMHREISTWELGVDIKSPTILRRIKGQNPLISPKWTLLSPDIRLLADTDEDWKNKKFQIQLWDTTTGNLLHTLVHTQEIESIAFSADSRTLVSNGDSTIQLWDTATGKLQSTSNWRRVPSTHTLAFSPKGRFLASGHRDGARLWDNTIKQKQQAVYAIGDYQHSLEIHGHKDYIYRLAFSPDEKTLLTGSKDGTIQAWDTATGRHRFTCTGYLEGFRGLAFSPDGDTLITLHQPVNPPGIVQQQRWDLNTGDQLSTRLLGIKLVSMVLAPNGKTLAGHASANKYVLWNINTDPPRIMDQLTLEGFPRSGLNVKSAFSSDGKMLAAGGEDGLVHVWNLTASNKVRHQFTVKRHNDWIRTLAFSPDAKMLASGDKGRTFCLWHVADGALLFTSTAHKSLVDALAFSPDAKILASGSNELFFWDTTTGGQLRTTSRELTARLSALVFSPDGNTLVAGNWDGILELWDVRTGGLLSTHTGHTRGINALKFSADSKTLVSGSFWGTILVWDWETLKKTNNR
ncbi:WD40 repeat domain-containing protein [Candidatus Poribacteria bacterium]|nr:WD40 repeat domain-containing protein [Candidatus Poribacteria bacterium]MXV72895.1 WD40 repeat domain-containing protein [Candidatus Poribacteria bacterium]MYB01569.1 WD40 repeat domain-containing protein [Candidatus Poribacteria bacterium]